MNKVVSDLILACSAVLLAVLNLFLWKILWDKTRDNPDGQMPLADDEVAEELKEKVSQSLERSIRLEDQLWGVLDRLKEMESRMSEIKQNISTDKDEKIREELNQFTEKVTRLNDILEIMDRNISELNLRLKGDGE